MNQATDLHPPLKTITEVRENTFIFEKRGALPLDICNEMIHRFEQHVDEQYEGRIGQTAVSYTHLTLPTTSALCRSRWSPYH